MPVQPTKEQKEIFENLKHYLGDKEYKYRGYNGSNDDSHKFGTPIKCYVQFISYKATIRPKGTVLVVVRTNEKNKNTREYLIGNYFHGQGSRHIFVIPNNQASYNKALRLINTI